MPFPPSTLPPPDPLRAISAKTSFYPASRPPHGGRRRILGPRSLASNYYHVMSRTCGGEIFFDDVEKEALRRLLWRLADFSGVQILTYCVMGNHFHALIAIPHRATWLQRFEGDTGEQRLMNHLRTLYSKSYIAQLQSEITAWRRLGQESMVQLKLNTFKRRMCDLSSFLKELKERFSRWYNKQHSRKGTLWMERYKSVLIDGASACRDSQKIHQPDALKAIAAYIDLNPVRAGLVTDPVAYPWCGYAEACAGAPRARRGLCRLIGPSSDSWDTREAEKSYAALLHGVDLETGVRRRGHSPATPHPATGSTSEIHPLTDSEVTPPLADLLKNRVRSFTECLVLGSKDFVDEVFLANRSLFGAKRREGARRIPHRPLPFYVARRVFKN